MTNHSAASFPVAADGVDPSAVPQRTLHTGAKMPAIGLGTFGSDHVSREEVAAAVEGALKAGYRHIDCAAVYGNEHLIGQVLEKALEQGLPRKELWITSKLWNDMHDEADVIPAFKQSLSALRLDYVDLYLIHWPFPNHHPPHADVGSRAPGAEPYIHDNYMKVWRQLEILVDLGLVRQIGTSNMTIPKLELLLRDARIMPAVNEMELHPHFQQVELFQYVRENGIEPVGYSPIGSPGRPQRDRTSGDTVDIEDPLIVQIADKHGVHPVAVCIKWAIQRGQTPIPFSTNRAHYLSNLRAAVMQPLTGDEMDAIDGIDRNCRLIKGQVFLWKDGQSWEDLWDVNGVITPP